MHVRSSFCCFLSCSHLIYELELGCFLCCEQLRDGRRRPILSELNQASLFSRHTGDSINRFCSSRWWPLIVVVSSPADAPPTVILTVRNGRRQNSHRCYRYTQGTKKKQTKQQTTRVRAAHTHIYMYNLMPHSSGELIARGVSSPTNPAAHSVTNGRSESEAPNDGLQLMRREQHTNH